MDAWASCIEPFKCMLCIHLLSSMQEAQAYKSLPTHSKWGRYLGLQEGKCPVERLLPHLEEGIALLAACTYKPSVCSQEAIGLSRGQRPLERQEASWEHALVCQALLGMQVWKGKRAKAKWGRDPPCKRVLPSLCLGLLHRT